jgi:hypothetical protein
VVVGVEARPKEPLDHPFAYALIRLDGPTSRCCTPSTRVTNRSSPSGPAWRRAGRGFPRGASDTGVGHRAFAGEGRRDRAVGMARGAGARLRWVPEYERDPIDPMPARDAYSLSICSVGVGRFCMSPA